MLVSHSGLTEFREETGPGPPDAQDDPRKAKLRDLQIDVAQEFSLEVNVTARSPYESI